MSEFFDKVILGNHISDYLLAVMIFIIVLAVIWLIEKFILRNIRRRIMASGEEKLISISNSFHKRIMPIINVTAIYAALQFIDVSDKIRSMVDKFVIVLVVFFILLFLTDLIRNLFRIYSRDENNLPGGLISILQVLVWVIGLLFMLANLGFNVTTFIAGLGIGGVAIALASQSILGDLFNYFVILFDKPFQKGDYIQVDNKMGNVEYIGIKSTRVRSITGELLLISNTDLTKSRIHNFEEMTKRRVTEKLGVGYNTNIDTLKKIPIILKAIIDSNKKAEFSRVHFSEFGDFSLNFELVYFVLDNDMIIYSQIVQEINFAISEAFDKNGIVFAYPTQSIHIVKE